MYEIILSKIKIYIWSLYILTWTRNIVYIYIFVSQSATHLQEQR